MPPAVKGGTWTESALYGSKGSADGRLPAATALALTTTETLYRVTTRGGTWDSGVLYRSINSPLRTYTESVLYCFGDLADAGAPNGPVVLDSKGCHLRRHGGARTQSTWFQFTYKVSGGYPSRVVTRERKTGTLYGTAIYGGIEGCDPYCGTVWQIAKP